MRLFKGCDEGVHRFEARYDKIQPEWMGRVEKLNCPVSRIAALYEHHYIWDVCVRCGATIKRDSKVVSLVRSA